MIRERFTWLPSAWRWAKNSIATPISELLSLFRLFKGREWVIAGIGGVTSLFLIGLPTAIIDNPLFTRMTPVRAQDYAIWLITAALIGLNIGTFVLSRRAMPSGKVASGGLLSYFAVGCPICNKLIVLLLGTAGALAWFAPLQLYLGLASIGMLVWCLHLRAKSLTGTCEVMNNLKIASAEAMEKSPHGDIIAKHRASE